MVRSCGDVYRVVDAKEETRVGALGQGAPSEPTRPCPPPGDDAAVGIEAEDGRGSHAEGIDPARTLHRDGLAHGGRRKNAELAVAVVPQTVDVPVEPKGATELAADPDLARAPIESVEDGGHLDPHPSDRVGKPVEGLPVSRGVVVLEPAHRLRDRA